MQGHNYEKKKTTQLGNTNATFDCMLMISFGLNFYFENNCSSYQSIGMKRFASNTFIFQPSNQSWNRFDFFGPAGLGFSTGPDRPVQINQLTAKYRLKTRRSRQRIPPAKNQKSKQAKKGRFLCQMLYFSLFNTCGFSQLQKRSS